MRQILFLFLIAGLVSCAGLKIDTKYIYEHNAYGVGSFYEFYADGTFHYSWAGGLIWGDTYGVWEKKGNKIVLNSDLQPSDLLSTIDASDSNIDDSITLSVSFSDTSYITSVLFVFYKNDEVLSTFESGWETLKESDTISLKILKPLITYDSIKIGCFGLDNALYKFSEDGYPDSLNCILKPFPRNYIYFTNKAHYLRARKIVVKRKTSSSIKIVYLIKKSDN